MKIFKIIGLSVTILFIGIVLALGINQIFNKFVSHSSEKPQTIQPLTSSKIEFSKPAVKEQVKSEEKRTDTNSKESFQGYLQGEISETKKSDEEDIQLIEEGSSSKETGIAITEPFPSSNITGPPVEPGKITKELPAFAPFGSYSGPSAATSTITVSRGSDTQGPTSITENTEKTYQDISASVPIENSGGPPIDPKKTYKELPPFTPVTNTAGPIAADKNK